MHFTLYYLNISGSINVLHLPPLYGHLVASDISSQTDTGLQIVDVFRERLLHFFTLSIQPVERYHNKESSGGNRHTAEEEHVAVVACKICQHSCKCKIKLNMRSFPQCVNTSLLFIRENSMKLKCVVFFFI